MAVKKGLAAGAAGALLAGALPAAGALYVYRTPEGSRLVTDHPVSEPGHRLLYRSSVPEGVGAVAAGRAPPPLTPAARRRFDPLIREVARRHRLDPALIKAVVHVESSFNPRAVSRKGALGLMQLMPETARRYGVRDPFDPVQNLSAGARHLRELLETYRHNKRLALAAYNAGRRAVERYRGIPPYPETRNYVYRVLLLTNRYAAKYYW